MKLSEESIYCMVAAKTFSENTDQITHIDSTNDG
jgi:hypothetical protein